MNSLSAAIVCFPVNDIKDIKSKMLTWINQFSIFCYLDNHQYPSELPGTECIAGAGAVEYFNSNTGGGLAAFNEFREHNRQHWLLGHFNYDLKNELEHLQSGHSDGIGFPDIFFFKPEIFLQLKEGQLEITAPDADAVFREIIATPVIKNPAPLKVTINEKVSKPAYIETVKQLKDHLLRGDCYEINYCIEYYSTDIDADPLLIYQQLSALSPNPFAAYYRVNDHYLLCASPERFLKKTGSKIISQPIKGTASRVLTDRNKDEQVRNHLINSEKDRAENVMVVDLVRNDLSKICVQGSVKVSELFGVYAFPQVYQMISTIEGELLPAIAFTDIIKAAFPMGSMTGAPKRKVMQLIETYETSKRGIYSGALGYIAPTGDFDFNVVIRSIMMNTANRYLSYMVGSAITYQCDPLQEWLECQHKVAAIKKVLSA